MVCVGGGVVVSGVVAFAGSRSSVSPLVASAVRSVLASGRDVVVGCARGVDQAVAAEVVGSGHAARLGIFAVAPVPAGSWAAASAASGASVVWVPGSAGRAAFAVRSRLVLAAAVAGGPGGGLVAFPSGPCPAVCAPHWGMAVERARVTGGGSGTWLAVALAVGAGLPVALFLPPGVSLPCWSGGDWLTSPDFPGVWSRSYLWLPAHPGDRVRSQQHLWGDPVFGPGPVPFAIPGSPSGDSALFLATRYI